MDGLDRDKITMTNSALIVAAAEYAVAESAVLGFEGNRDGAEYEALKLDWERATVRLGRAAREAGKKALARIGDAIAPIGRESVKVGEAV